MSAWGAVLTGATALALLAVGAELFRRFRHPLTAAERERRRRLKVDAEGRMSDAALVEVRGTMVYYRYQVGGVEYTASQDLGPLVHLLPAQLTGLSGHASIKYLAENPANSIVASENWCGLHRRPDADSQSQA